MTEWVITSCRAEAKIFERRHRDDDFVWQKTMTNKKGRRHEGDMASDAPGMSYAKFSKAHSPHALPGKHRQTEISAMHFAKKISEMIRKSYLEKRFDRLTIFAGAHFLGILRAELNDLEKVCPISFVPKNIEKETTERIASYLG